jgi:hypothetical protein
MAATRKLEEIATRGGVERERGGGLKESATGASRDHADVGNNSQVPPRRTKKSAKGGQTELRIGTSRLLCYLSSPI